MSRLPRSTTLLAALCLTMAVSCSDQNPLKRQAVSGMILLDGKPLSHGSIQFIPETPTGLMSGATIADGAYRIDWEQGLPPGEYLVRISAAGGEKVVVDEPGESGKVAKELIPPQFNVKSQEKIKVEVGAKNEFNYDIPAA